MSKKLTAGEAADLLGSGNAPGPLVLLSRARKLTAKVKYQISRIVVEVRKLAEPFVMTRDSLIEKHGQKGSVTSEMPGWGEFLRELREPAQEEVEVTSPPVEIPGDYDGEELTAEILEILDGLIVVK